MKRTIMLSLLFVFTASIQAAPFVTTFVNTTPININFELHFSGEQIMNKGVAMSQSYQVVNFDDKRLKSIVFSSQDKDKNGNYYGQLTQEFTPPQTDVTYNLSLQDVPAHTVAASAGTDAFEMPATQKIICTLAPVGNIVQQNNTAISQPAPAIAPAVITQSPLITSADKNAKVEAVKK